LVEGGKLLLASGVGETIFYLPNRIRLFNLLNPGLLVQDSNENLLNLMSLMFNLKGEEDFSVGRFLSSYQRFFKCTLVYEALTFSTRVMMSRQLQ